MSNRYTAKVAESLKLRGWIDEIQAKALHADNARLKGEVEHQSDLLKLAIADSCDDDTKIRDLCRPLIGEKQCDHDGYGVVPLVTVVESTLATYKAAVEKAKEWFYNIDVAIDDTCGSDLKQMCRDAQSTLNSLLGDKCGVATPPPDNQKGGS